MMYDDDYEDDEVVNTPPAGTPSIPVPDVQVAFTIPTDRIEEHVKSHVALAVRKAFDDYIKVEVRRTVSDLVGDIGRDYIDAEIRAVMAEGWIKTDNYGQPCGKASFRERINELLTKFDRYEGRSMMDRIVKDELDKALRGDLQKELEAARAKIRAEVDGIVRAKLAEALRGALGLGQ